jgi:hypothetical protein
MQRTTYCQEDEFTFEVSSVENKTIVLPFDETSYPALLADRTAYKAHIGDLFQRHPELFPEAMNDGWILYGMTRPSAKQALRLRRLQTTRNQEVWQIRPAFVLPYMTCDTATADDMLFLTKWVPDWALARVFKKDVMTIYRLRTSLGRYNLVGTTVKTPDIPKHVAADEKHTRLAGEKVYVATTVAENCFLGASVSPSADEAHLTQAYRQFQREAQQIQPTYQPETVNTDGWQATMKAWRAIFPTIVIIQCFLHAILSIKQVTTKAMNAVYDEIAEHAWRVYHATTKPSFSQRLRRFREWGMTMADSPLKDKLVNLSRKKAWFLPAYDFPQCLRTSNMIDRLMRGLDKYLFAKHYFHGTRASAERSVRAYCLLSNFRPAAYNPIAGYKSSATRSPFEQLNGFTYHDCWLQNLLIATSTQRIYRFQHKKLE